VGTGLLEGVRGEKCGSLGLEKWDFCQIKDNSREWRVLEVWQAAGQHRDMRFGCRSASSAAWCPKHCPCKRVSSLFWAAVGTWRDMDRQISAPEEKGWGSAIDGNKNIIFLQTFPGLASAPIHQRLLAKLRASNTCWFPSGFLFPRQSVGCATANWSCYTQGSVRLTGWLGTVMGVNRRALHFNFCPKFSADLVRVCQHKTNGELVREGTAFPQIIMRF